MSQVELGRLAPVDRTRLARLQRQRVREPEHDEVEDDGDAGEEGAGRPSRRTCSRGRRRGLNQAALPHLERFHIEVSPRALVKNISISEQQLLQIARALTNRSAEVLILDEPTTSLTEQETERLFRIVRRLKDEKHSVVFISHKLEEIYALGDEITVMRNGEQVASAPIGEMTQRQLIVLMSGRGLRSG